MQPYADELRLRMDTFSELINNAAIQSVFWQHHKHLRTLYAARAQSNHSVVLGESATEKKTLTEKAWADLLHELHEHGVPPPADSEQLTHQLFLDALSTSGYPGASCPPPPAGRSFTTHTSTRAQAAPPCCTSTSWTVSPATPCTQATAGGFRTGWRACSLLPPSCALLQLPQETSLPAAAAVAAREADGARRAILLHRWDHPALVCRALRTSGQMTLFSHVHSSHQTAPSRAPRHFFFLPPFFLPALPPPPPPPPPPPAAALAAAAASSLMPCT